MGFSLQLAQDLIEVEAGGNSPVSISVTNKGDTADRFELEIEGLDSEWKAVPVPVFTVEAGETHSERAFLKPPRVSESLAGNYPFVVRVRSLESGEQKIAQGVLHLKPYHYLTMEIDPRKGVYSWSTHSNSFQIQLANLGNTEHTLQLMGSDPEDACAYEFEAEQVSLAPGQQKEISVKVTPVTSPIISGSKLIGFSVHARSTEVPSVAAAGQAQLERRSLLSPANLALVIFLFILFGAWFVMKPKPPGIEVTANPLEGLPGDKVVVSWVGHDADHVTLYAVDSLNVKTQIYDGNALESSQPIVLGSSGSESIFAEVTKGNNHSVPLLKATLKVDVPPQKVEPVIADFEGSTHRIRVPGDVVFSWSVANATKVALVPDFNELPPELGSQTVHFLQAGEKDYVLVAWSKDGITKKSKKWHVTAYDESKANIVSFTAAPDSVMGPGGPVIISWNVVNQTSVSLTYGGTKLTSLPASGTQSVTINSDTEFILRATDSNNVSTSKRLVVKVKAPTPPNPTSTTSGPADGTTATGTTSGAPTTSGPTTGDTSTDTTSGQGRR